MSVIFSNEMENFDIIAYIFQYKGILKDDLWHNDGRYPDQIMMTGWTKVLILPT